MAITKIKAVKSTVYKALDYIIDENKTDGKLLVTGYNCNPETASFEFDITKESANILNSNIDNKNGNQAYHLMQSFAITDNITPDQAHQIGKELADEFLQGKHEYVIATHVDKGHIHNHIIINATSFYTHKKLRTQPYKTASMIRGISDNLCHKNNLSVVENPSKLKSSYKEWSERKNQTSWKKQLTEKLIFIKGNCQSYDEFLEQCKKFDIQVDNEGKHIKFKLEGQERWARGKTLAELDVLTYDEICNSLKQNSLNEEFERVEEIPKFEKGVKDLIYKELILEESDIKKIYKDGILTNYKEQQIFIDSNYINYDKDNNKYHIFICDRFNYNLTDNKSVKGSNLISYLDKTKNTNFTEIELQGSELEFMSEKGCVFKFGTDTVFIPKEDIEVYDTKTKIKIKIYNNTNYKLNKETYVPAAELIEKINNSSSDVRSIYNKIKFVNRKEMIKETKTLASYLLNGEERITNKKIDILDSEQIIKERDVEIKKNDKGISSCKEALKFLLVINEKKDIYENYGKQNILFKKKFYNENCESIDMYVTALKKLDEIKLSSNIDIEKVKELIHIKEDKKQKLTNEQKQDKMKVVKLKAEIQNLEKGKEHNQKLNKDNQI